MELVSGITNMGVTDIRYKKDEVKWRGIINLARGIYDTLELESVVHDQRKCMLTNKAPFEMEQFSKEMIQKGLFAVPIRNQGVSSGFGHVASATTDNNFEYRVVITKDIKIANHFSEAFNSGDDNAVGKLLGFPASSRIFFDEVWKKGYFDPIWQQAENTPATREIQGITYTLNIKQSDIYTKLLPIYRYIGIRVVPFFAQAFNDDTSAKFADEWIQLAQDLGMENEMNSVLEVLSLPSQWYVYKGNCIVQNEFFDVVTTSLPTKDVHVVKIV